jgi:hypothetical protein
MLCVYQFRTLSIQGARFLEKAQMSLAMRKCKDIIVVSIGTYWSIKTVLPYRS